MSRHTLILLALFLVFIGPTIAQELCQIDTNCPRLHNCIDGQCVHKNFFPLTATEIVGLITMVLISGLLNTGGAGGGALLTPILIILFNYEANAAISLVYGLLFGGSVGNFVNVVRQKDPRTNKPLISYDVVLMCMPCMLFGSSIGVVLSRSLAPLMLILGTLGVIAYPTMKIYRKAKKQYAEETVIKKESARLIEPDEDTESAEEHVHRDSSFWQSEEEELIEKEEQKLNRMEHSRFPKRKYSLIVGLILIMLVMILLRGTSKVPSIAGVGYCSAGYFALVALSLGICCAILLVNKKFISWIREKKVSYNISTKDNFDLTPVQLRKLSVIALIAGVLAGLLGIGGGMILTPTLLTMGVPSQIVTATSGFFIVQTSFLSLFQAALYQDIPLYDQMFVVAISLIGSFVVSYILNWLVGKYKRPSIILFVLLAVRGMIFVVTPIFEIWQYSGKFDQLIDFKPICA